MNRAIGAIALALVLSVAGGIGIANRPADGPAQPSTAASAGVVPTGQDLSGTIAALQSTLRRLPEDDRSWATLGLAYVEQARVTGNPAYYGKADSAVARSFQERADENFAALAASAALLAARHDFTGALALAEKSLRIDPRGPGALSVRVDALTELGRYADQLRALRIADRRQPGVSIAARYSYAYELRGQLGRAASILRRALDAGSRSDRGYLLTLLGDIERRRGNLPQADAALTRALAESPDYLATRVSLARLATARGQLKRSARQWRRVVARLPLPEYLTELGELYQHLGRPQLASQQFAVVESTLRLFTANGVNTDLEAALYAADHGSAADALAPARDEWRRRKSIHVADVLGWALHQTGNDARALVLARKATRLDTPEARLWIHRGTIEAALGMNSAAREHLQRGLATDPGLSPWQADRAHAVLNRLGGQR